MFFANKRIFAHHLKYNLFPARIQVKKLAPGDASPLMVIQYPIST